VPESGKWRRADLPLALDANGDLNSRPTEPDALRPEGEGEAALLAALDLEDAPESRRTSLGPFRYLRDED
jgi:hypothetical protein